MWPVLVFLLTLERRLLVPTLQWTYREVTRGKLTLKNYQNPLLRQDSAQPVRFPKLPIERADFYSQNCRCLYKLLV